MSTQCAPPCCPRRCDGTLTLNAEITNGLLAMVDAIRRMLAEIQASGVDGEEDYAALVENLDLDRRSKLIF